jgi:predicted RNase H-like HicB family nuclease
MKKMKKKHASAEAFSDLLESAEQALDYERGARDGYRVTRIAASQPLQPVSIKQGTNIIGRHRGMRYKGFMGAVTLDEDGNIFYGEVINTRDVITFQGASLEECRQAFRGSVYEYLEFCRERGEEPDKPL